MTDGATSTRKRPRRPDETPVRALGGADESGYRVLRDTALPYRDGAEAAVLDIISAAQDLSSGSVEMVRAAVGWAQRYHVDPARGNVLRGLELPSTARVLEIGAGCGAITRYLGENCALVDALEPVPSRAVSAAARTRDLPGVQVFVGELDDVPDVAAYDVIAVIGVLEYVGSGSADRQPYLDFLAGIRSRLAPGGTLVLAIENKLGVKYLVGSPEDHTNRVFDSIEGYPRGGKAHTFSRRELEQLLTDAGLTPTTRIAFPDYKMTRTVLGELPDSTRSLLHRIPYFPSPDWRTARPHLADERAVWQTLVEAGLELEFGNSFLVLAGRDGPSTLWPADQGAVFYTSNRRKHLNTATVVERSGDTVLFRRTSDPDAVPDGDIRVVGSESAFEPGVDLVTVLADEGAAAFARFVPGWFDLLDTALAGEPVSAIDVVPHNLVVTDTGALRIIDVEFTGGGVTREQVIRRGVYWLAVRATPIAVPERWAPARTVGDVMRTLGELAGLPADGSWIELAIAEEIDFLTSVRVGPPPGSTVEHWREQTEARLHRNVARVLRTQPLGVRLMGRAAKAQDDLKTARARVRQLEKQVAATNARLARSEAARKKLAASRALRASRRVTRALARLAPRGTRRRAVAARLLGRAR